jgi:hypothetical protein
LNRRYVIHVFRVTPRKRLKEFDPLLDEQTVDVLKETQAGGRIVEHLFTQITPTLKNDESQTAD